MHHSHTLPGQSARKRVIAWILLVALIVLMMLPNLIWFGYFHHAWPMWLKAIVLPSALLAVLFALCGKRIWIACLVLTPFALLAPLECFYIARYHNPSTPKIIATLHATSLQETTQYLGHLVPFAIALPLAALLLALAAAWWTGRARMAWRGRSRQWLGAIAILVAIPLVAVSIGTSLKHHRPFTASHKQQHFGNPWAFVGAGYPFGLLPRFVRFGEQWHAVRAQARTFANFSFHAHRVSPQPHARQIYVMVIGESSNRSHWQLFGYDRPTNPELSKLTNLVPIRRMVSSWPETIAAVPVMLTRKPMTSDHLWLKEPSFLPAMQEAGFTTWWISNQYPIGRYDSAVAMYAYEAQHSVWVNHSTTAFDPGSYDEALIAPLKRAIAGSHHDLFIVLHMLGSHRIYDYRYPPAFARFQPTLSSGAKGGIAERNLVNSYDNTIVYTDHILAQVIGVLKHSGAVTALWYESDHGETLLSATCPHLGHGYGNWHDFEIPALFWYSNGYQQTFPKRVAALRANADKRTLSANTFESLIDMAGVTFPSHNETWSLFSPRWHYRRRIVAQYWYTDFDHAVVTDGCGTLKPPSHAPKDAKPFNPATTR